MSTAETLTKQTLIDHLAELRSCLVISMAAVAAGFAIAYSFNRPLADWFLQPLIKVLPENKTLIFISYQEGFFFT
jgi:Sec-independent protein secretion pathway component TatC